jgi:hypothetical protein
MRHTYRSWLDAAGTTVAVQQKPMRHGDIRTTVNVYGDVVTNEMQEAIRRWSRWPCRSLTDLQLNCVFCKFIEKWRKRVGVETARERQTKDLTEHGQQLSPRKCVKKQEVILSDLFRRRIHAGFVPILSWGTLLLRRGGDPFCAEKRALQKSKEISSTQPR